ncbi:heavy-metal-associated domain-containing protein [Porphyrobacter sp. GA68]|uniref:heavy-metal-associated domain-containing protein n=1 Tax=Porphyrobacter sp. GA68 TaxID=2883480 RepID=UPI001D17F7E8|nr:heavy-metal-associated domain-containing protein [Porphyrobacter sp. GA68]
MMLSLPPIFRPLQRGRYLLFAGLAVLGILLCAAVLLAQVGGDRGIAPVAVTTDIEVGGIQVNVRGDSPEAARVAGWREAQQLAWKKIGGPDLPDSQLESLVSAIIIEEERIGPRRYIATLGVIFDRQRAGRLLGEAGQLAKSPPMLVIPVTLSAGTATTFEMRNAWQRAWAEFQPGSSRIDYVRPSGAGGQSLLINYGQAERRSRYWWRNILDQFSASGVVIPMVRLNHLFPGGPVEGEFTARFGPDNRYLDSFRLQVDRPEQLPAMLAQAVRRFDQIYTQAFNAGLLGVDPTLALQGGEIDPGLRRLMEIGEQLRAAERQRNVAAQAAEPAATPAATPTPAAPAPTAEPAVVSVVTVQFATPDAGSVDAILGAVRSIPQVRSATTRSLALGGTSAMTVQFTGNPTALIDALRERGFTVQQGGSVLTISR